ncbi:unnamed protein product [Closterium sp. Naga37s-1]|nr:unnamed protein product [Closterium sp. Naga37s-1]
MDTAEVATWQHHRACLWRTQVVPVQVRTWDGLSPPPLVCFDGLCLNTPGHGGGGGLAAPQSVPVAHAGGAVLQHLLQVLMAFAAPQKSQEGLQDSQRSPFSPLPWPFPTLPHSSPTLCCPPFPPLPLVPASMCLHIETLDPTSTNSAALFCPFPFPPLPPVPASIPHLHQLCRSFLPLPLSPSDATSTNSSSLFPPRPPNPTLTPSDTTSTHSASPYPPSTPNPQSPSDATSTNSAALSAAQSTSSDPKDGRGTARKFRLHELRAATSSFSKKAVLGRGSFGEVYLGKLGGKESKEVVEVAVKKLNPESSQGLDEWLAEIVLLRKLHHPNLVELIGYCAEKGEALLVYGLCPNGSLDDRLFPRREVDIIDWPTRVRIAQGAAQGLLHLHENKVIHRDLKPSNILLDQDMQARITDFGMAKQSASSVSHISTRVMGTMGYLDPEYMETGCLRDKSDVYSLGVILLQMLTGRDAVSKEGNVKLVAWMGPHLYPNITEPEAWIDPNLQGRFSRRGAKMLAAVAKQCSARHKEDRPEMSDVAQALMSVPLAD